MKKIPKNRYYYTIQTQMYTMIRTLNESSLVDWGCLASNSNRSNSTMAKIALEYAAKSLLSWAPSCWTVVKQNNVDVQTAKGQTARVQQHYIII